MKRLSSCLAAWVIVLILVAPASQPALSSRPTVSPDAGLVWVSIIATPAAPVDAFFVGPIYRRPIGSLQHIAGHVRSEDLPALNKLSGVAHVSTGESLPQPPQPDPGEVAGAMLDPNLRGADRAAAIIRNAQRSPSSAKPVTPSASTSWYENDTQGVHDTWRTFGITGTGVTIAVIDSGVDFGNPALNGRYAVETATLTGTQAYAGWPIAFDDRSLREYLPDPNRVWPNNWGWYVNAGYVITGSGVFTFADPLTATHVYTAPGTSLSGRYYLGYHPDALLGNAPALVADTVVSGTYDSVYMDLNYDGAFDTLLRKDHPVGALDLTGDGVPDISAGMMYWIADGVHPPPGAYAVYGPDVPVPPAGRLIAFMIDTTVANPGGGHGTLCASTAIGNDGGVFTPTLSVASFYTTTYGPLVQGPAPGAKLIALGNVYVGGSLEAWYLFTLLGYDGVPGSGDEPQIVSLSYGDGSLDNDGWDWESRYLTYLNLTYDQLNGPGKSPLFVHSAGNGGYGYGTLISPSPATGLTVGASTQFGTFVSASYLGVSETVRSPNRVNYGDIASFSGRGPGADGTRSVDLVANGQQGTGAYPLNYSGNGVLAYVHWNGTSRSSPDVAGMGALAAQAFRQTHGRFPTRDELRQLLLNTTTDLGYNVMTQGAGQANAFRAVQAALDQYGVTIDPPQATFGSYRGQHYPSFAAGLLRGQTQTQTFTVTNASPVPITLTLSAQRLTEIVRYTATMQTITDTATNYAKGVPDYAIDLTHWITSHPDADLMVVRLTTPFEHFDTLPPTPPASRNAWRLMAYNWWDDNGNRQWWTDLNGDGRVNWLNEIDNGDQWLRFDFGQLNATQQEVRVGQPYTRSIEAGSAGVWVGAAHYVRSSGDNRTTLSFEVTFYRAVPWPDVSLSTGVLHLPPHGQATFEATAQVPSDATYGLQSGSIVVTDPGRLDIDPAYQPRQSTIPIAWQVWPDVAAGAVLTDQVGGGFGWQGRGEEGDCHFYGFDLVAPPAGSVIIAHSVWEDYPTDIDTLIMGPTADEFSNTQPDWFGPYTLDLIGGSVRSGTRPSWGFQTATGATEEWGAVAAQDGLHMLAQQAVLLGGHQASVPFTTTLGLAYVRPYPLRTDPLCSSLVNASNASQSSCTITATFRANLDITDGLTGTHTFGWVTPAYQSTPLIQPGQSVTHSLIFTEAIYRLDVELQNVIGASDLDLTLYDDTGSISGTLDAADQVLAQSTGFGIDEHLQAHRLITGTYWLLVTGWAVDPGGGSYTLEMTPIARSVEGGLSLGNLPTAVASGQDYTFTVRSNASMLGGQRGLIVLGTQWLTESIEAPVLAQATADVWVHKTGPLSARPGELITYTITYGNHGPSTAHNVWLTDTLPVSITATTPTTRSVATLAPNAIQTWTLTATAAIDLLSSGIALTNTASIDGQEYDPAASNNVARSTLISQVYALYLPILTKAGLSE